MEDNIFEVGLPIAIETFFKSYLTTHLIGWEPDICLITGVVQSGGTTGKLKVNDHCKMRFLKDGIAYGFETKILAISFNPLPLMFCRYPSALQKFAVRKFDRIKVNLPAQLKDLQENIIVETIITDISAGGCGLRFSAKENSDLKSEKHYKIAFSAMEMDLTLHCAIRKIQALKDGQEIGVEFIHISGEEQEKLKLFLEACLRINNSRTDFILSKMKKTDKLFAGNLSEVSMIDTLQIIDQLGKDGVIHVTSGKQKGMIAIKNGHILNASLGPMKGEDALVELLSFQEGEFHVSAGEIPSGHMNNPINFALMEICRLNDERASLLEFIPAREERLCLVNPPHAEEPEIQTVIDALQRGASSISQIHEMTGLSLIRSSLSVASLLKENALQKDV